MADNHGSIVDQLSSLVNGLKEQRRVQRETETVGTRNSINSPFDPQSLSAGTS